MPYFTLNYTSITQFRTAALWASQASLPTWRSWCYGIVEGNSSTLLLLKTVRGETSNYTNTNNLLAWSSALPEERFARPPVALISAERGFIHVSWGLSGSLMFSLRSEKENCASFLGIFEKKKLCCPLNWLEDDDGIVSSCQTEKEQVLKLMGR